MTQKAKWIGGVLLATAMTTLAGCSEKEEILAGERMNVRDVLQNQPEGAAGANEYASRPISLPSASVNSGWAQSMVSPHTRVSNAALSKTLAPLWSVEIGAGDSRRARLNVNPVAADGRIFVMDSAHVVRAVSTGGQVLWSHDVTPLRDDAKQGQGGGLAYADGRLYVASGFGTLSALDPVSGQELWVKRLGATATGAPMIRDGLLYIVSGDQVAWAIEADTGRIRWQIEGLGDINNLAGAAAPAVGEKFVVFSFGGSSIQAAFRKGGLRKWNADILGRRNGVALSVVDDITGDPVISGDTVFAGNHTGRIVALNVNNGDRIWTAKHGALGPVWPVGGSVFVVSDLNQLLRLDAGSGEEIWAVDLPNWVERNKPNRKRDRSYVNHGPIMAGGRLIVAGNDGVIRSYNPEDGQLRATLPIEGGATTRPIVMGNTLYVVSADGVLHAYR